MRGSVDRIRLRAIPVFVLLVSLAFTVLAVWYVDDSWRRAQQVRFERSVAAVLTQIDRRLTTYINVLYATSGFMTAAETVQPQDFREFVNTVQLEERYPGVQAIGFSRRIGGPDEVEAFEERWRARIGDHFRVWPADPRREYHSTVLIEPLDDRNRAALGYDMSSHPVRNRAMMDAEQSGEPATSGSVTLVQEIYEERQPGFLIYVPVYRDESVEGSGEPRRSLRGFAYGAFRAHDFFRAATDPSLAVPVRFEIYDGVRQDPAALLYTSGERIPEYVPPAAMSRSVNFAVPGRSWTFVFEAAPGIHRGEGRSLTFWTAAVGIALSLILWLATSALARARNQAEERARELRASEEALRESQSRMRRLVEANIIGIVTIESGGRVLEANDAFLRMLGYERDDTETDHLDINRLIDSEDRRAVLHAEEELKTRGVHAPFETTLFGRGGRRVPVLIGAALTSRSSDQAIAFVIDVTDRKRAEEERDRLLERERELRAAAEAANVAKDEFLATLSHELRTPMTAILGWARMMEGENLEQETIRQGIEAIRRSGEVQAQLIDDLLDVSRIMVGKLRLSQKDLDVRSVVTEAVEALQQTAKAKEIDLRLDLPEEPAPVWGDPSRLQQVLWNLVSNAVKFTPQGGTVEVSSTLDRDSALVTVRDTGVGISAEFLPHVFERFRQADATTTRSHGGLGLGLSISRTIVELHGGRISVESGGTGKGSTFTIMLPLSKAGALKVDEGGAARRGLARDALDGVAVLLVEDNLEVRQMVEVTLRRLGAAVMAASSVDEALDALAVRSFDVVVSDIAMPGRDGFDLIRDMRSSPSPSTRSVPALALTAYARDEDVGRFRHAGFEDVVFKPVDAEALTSAILEAVEQGEG